ncbi:MAG TPA: hypothetical protein PK639_00090 [Candidatus Woesebacteria bacterium]|nr:hypothetical protein [Candidatus Woesebacteria bacterium]
MKRELNIGARVVVVAGLILSGCGVKNSTKSVEAVETPTPISTPYFPSEEKPTETPIIASTVTPSVTPTGTETPVPTVKPTETATDTVKYKAEIPATIDECNTTPTTAEGWKKYNEVLQTELAKRTIEKDITINPNENSFSNELPYSYYDVAVYANNILGCSVEKDANGTATSLTLSFADKKGRIFHAKITSIEASKKFAERYDNGQNPQSVVDQYDIEKIIERLHNGELNGVVISVFTDTNGDSPIPVPETEEGWEEVTEIIEGVLDIPIEANNNGQNEIITKYKQVLGIFLKVNQRKVYSDELRDKILDFLNQPGKLLPSPVFKGVPKSN